MRRRLQTGESSGRRVVVDDIIDQTLRWANAAERCVKNGDVQTLRRLLRGGADSAAKELERAEETNPAALQNTLIELDPLHTATAMGRREMVQFLLTEIAHWLVMVHDKEGGATALHTCARFGRVDIANDLLGYGALVYSRDRGGCTALHIACEHGNEELVRLLLAAGSPVNTRDKDGCTPLFTCVRAGGSLQVLQLLIDRGVDVDAVPDGEPTAFALASGMGCSATVRLLASAGADLLAAAENLGGETPLHLAAKNGSENVLCFLLAAGCWAETKDADGRTPLASACAGGRVGTAAMLLTGEGWAQHQVPENLPLDLGWHVLSFLVAAPDTPDLVGNSPLLAACEHRGTPEVLKLLAAYGADFSNTNHFGETALHVACRRGNAALAKYLLEIETSSGVTRTSGVEASVDAIDIRGRRPGEVRDIDVGVHEAMAIREVVGRDSVRGGSV